MAERLYILSVVDVWPSNERALSANLWGAGTANNRHERSKVMTNVNLIIHLCLAVYNFQWKARG